MSILVDGNDLPRFRVSRLIKELQYYIDKYGDLEVRYEPEFSIIHGINYYEYKSESWCDSDSVPGDGGYIGLI